MAYSTRNSISEQQRDNTNVQTAIAPFIDNRTSIAKQQKQQMLMGASPKATAQRATVNTMNTSTVQQQKIIQRAAPEEELQMRSIHQATQLQKDKLKKKNKQKPISISKPSHSQEEIQDEMIQLWQINAANDQDQLRANYAWNYRKVEGGWCDGWSYVLSMGRDELAETWAEIDSLIGGGDQLNSTSKYHACTLARKASLYHIMNQDPPAAGTQQNLDYQAANFDSEQTPGNREIWKHDEDATLEMYVIEEEIKSLADGQTLRLTSPIHDAAVKRIKGGYIVSETESHGVQKCEKLQEALLILDEWRVECEKNNFPFFNQTMIV